MTIRHIIAGFLMGLATITSAAELRLADAVRLPAGVRIRMPKGFVGTPAKSPVIATYTRTTKSTGEKQNIEAVEPLEQWRFNQQIARFDGGEQGAITLARLNHMPVADVKELSAGHVQKGEYLSALAGSPPPKDLDAFKKWVETWTGQTANAPVSKLRGVLIRSKFLFFTFPGTPVEQDHVWLLSQKNGALMIRVQLPKLSTRDAQKTTINVVKSVSEIRQATTSTTKTGGSDAMTEARERVTQGIKNVPGWWSVETKNYVIASNLENRSSQLVKILKRDIELIRAGFKALFPPLRPITEVSVVRVFKDQEGYQREAPAEMKWSVGVWNASRKELAIAGDKSASSRELQEKVLGTAWHEAFHQYFHYAYDRRTPPLWFNEGFASLFESCEIDVVRKRMRIVDNKKEREYLQYLIKRHPELVDVERVMRADRNEFYAVGMAGEAAKQFRSANYTTGWGLAWFFAKAAPQYPGKGYEKVIPTMMAKLKTTHDETAIRAAALSVINPDQLKKDFLDFWTSDRKQSKAERHLILPKL